MSEKKVFFVEGEDRRRFRMICGDLDKLSVAMVRKFLRPQGVPEGHDLYAHGQRLEDHMLGRDFGLSEGDVLQLRPPGASQGAAAPTAVSSRGRVVASAAPQSAGQRQPQSPHAACGEAMEESRGPPPALQSTASPRDAALHDENRQLREEIQYLRKELHRLELDPAAARQRGTSSALTHNANESLRVLGEALGVSLQFGHDLTCSIGTPETTIFITLDPPTERLYVYASLLTSLPHDPELRYKLYEVLLQGSLLSREVCGGGIGVSLESEVVMLSTSLFIGHCGPQALAETIPVFVTALSRWRRLLGELLAA
eukprot:gene3650-2585_t